MISKLISKKKFYDICAILILGYSFLLSLTYSTYHIDPWHWGTIASEATDYIKGFKLFKDITLMYGPGMPIFFKIANYFYPINYFTIGVFTSLVYITNLLFCYLIFLKLSSRIIAITLLFIIFILNPYPQVPWSDFYSGFCITLFLYFLINSNDKNMKLYLSGFFLFLSIAFRNTYLLTILPTIFFFVLITFFMINKFEFKISKIFLSFFFFLLLFFCLLLITENLQLWYEQGIGRSQSYFEYDFTLTYNPLTKFIYNLIIPKTVGNFIFFIFYLLNFIFLIVILFFKKKLNSELNKNILIFLCLLGLFGTIQSFDQFEVWRNLNSSISVFIISAYILKSFKTKFLQKFSFFIFFIFIFGIIFMIPNPFYNVKYSTLIFPTFGHMDHKDFRQIQNDPQKTYWEWKKYSKDEFKTTNIKFFNSHRFSEENIIYYKNMESLICNYNKIINLTMDRTLVYLCDKKNGVISSFSDRYPPKFFNQKLQKNIEAGNIDNQTIILADKNFKNKGLKLLKVQKIPLYTRFSKGALYRRYFDNEIYIYGK